MRIPAALAVLLLVSVPVLAHGEGAKHISITDTGCSLTEPPCLLPDSGSSVVAGATTVVEFTNDLETTQQAMVHLDQGGQPGALIADVTPVAPGQTVELSFDVPADATGVWYMTLQDGEESARLFGSAVSPEGEDSPGVGVLLLGALGVAAVAARRRKP